MVFQFIKVSFYIIFFSLIFLSYDETSESFKSTPARTDNRYFWPDIDKVVHISRFEKVYFITEQ